MTAHFMVLLTEESDPARGEVKFLNGPDDVAHYIEVLLEGGFARENIRVFHGDEIELEISYRPVVSLSTAGEGGSEPDGEEPSSGGEGQNGAVPTGEASEGDDAQGVIKGVRFSELFRPS